jgi:hypothetical protein
MTPNFDTINILAAMREELKRAREAFDAQPNLENFKTMQWHESKVAEYEARAQKRQG